MIHHGDTEARSKLLHEELTEHVIGAAIEVHRTLGPGLRESAYEECLKGFDPPCLGVSVVNDCLTLSN